MKRRIAPILVSAGLVGALALTGCGQAGQETTTVDGKTELSMWTHSAGNPAELAVYEQIIEDFNSSQDEYTVVNEAFPQGAYNEAIVAAAASGDLPCLLDLDGPIMPNWAWAEYLQPLELPTEITDSLLPTAVGVWNDEIYSAGYWDAALSIFARKSVLDENGIRIPIGRRAVDREEFDSALATLKDAGYETPIDIGAEDTGEWWPYAYSPLLQSFGGDLIDRDTMLTADGALNGPEAVAWGEWFQGLFESGYASTAARSATRSSSTVTSHSATPGCGTRSRPSMPSATTSSSCPRRTSATAPRSAAVRGSGGSPRTARPRTVRGSTWSSASRTSTSPSSPTPRS